MGAPDQGSPVARCEWAWGAGAGRIRRDGRLVGYALGEQPGCKRRSAVRRVGIISLSTLGVLYPPPSLLKPPVPLSFSFFRASRDRAVSPHLAKLNVTASVQISFSTMEGTLPHPSL